MGEKNHDLLSVGTPLFVTGPPRCCLPGEESAQLESVALGVPLRHLAALCCCSRENQGFDLSSCHRQGPKPTGGRGECTKTF